VIDDGRLFWMQDAYTTSSYFPVRSTRRASTSTISAIRDLGLRRLAQRAPLATWKKIRAVPGRGADELD
jgi:hypothetical protein